MAYCGPRGIPHSHFLGGPPVWTALDRDKALWWQIHHQDACPDCGTRPDEWDPAKGGHDQAYTAALFRCWGCEEKVAAEKRITESMGVNVTARLIRNPEAM